MCQSPLLREYRRDIGGLGFAQAKALLGADSLSQARELAAELIALTNGRAAYWCVKALKQGLAHLATGHDRHKTTSRLERFHRELRRRERMCTGWTMHNLLLLQLRGLLSSTT